MAGRPYGDYVPRGRVAGGNPPMRPDQQIQVPGSQAGSGPAPQNAFIIAQRVIVFGTGPNRGVFVYSPSPGAGNLVASITAASGTDQYGNAYQAGITSYTGATTFVEIVNSQITFTFAGVNQGAVSVGAGNLRLQGSNTFVHPALLTLFNTATTSQILINAGVLSTTAALEIANAGGTSASVALQNATAPAAATGFGAELFSHNGALAAVDALDGLTYDTERKTALIASQTVSGLTTLASFTVAARAYEFDGVILSANAVAAGSMTVAFALAGGAVVSSAGLLYEAGSIVGGAVTPTASVLTTLTSAFATSNANTNNQYLRVKGQVTFSAGGTVNFTATETIGGDTISVLPSKMTFYPVS